MRVVGSRSRWVAGGRSRYGAQDLIAFVLLLCAFCPYVLCLADPTSSALVCSEQSSEDFLACQ